MSDLKSKERCSGSYPALWSFTYSHEAPVRIEDGCGDSTFSHMETFEGQFDVVAITEGLAIETFKLAYPAHVYKLKSGPTFVCYVDAIMHFARNYGGHFS